MIIFPIISNGQNQKSTNSVTNQTTMINSENENEIVEKIATFLVQKYKSDLNYLTVDDRKFSYYSIDLNNDTKNEYLVYLQGRYFCGTGGCSFYLLNNNFTVNSNFTVMRPPILFANNKTSGWKDIILTGNSSNNKINEYIYIKYNTIKKKYPNNPSIIKKSKTAPIGNIISVWETPSNSPKIHAF